MTHWFLKVVLEKLLNSEEFVWTLDIKPCGIAVGLLMN